MNLTEIFHKIKNFGFLLTILSVFILALILEPYLSPNQKVFFVTISSNIRNLLNFSLPLIIFPFIASSINSIKSNSLNLVIMILIGVFISNFIAVIIGYFAKIYITPTINVATNIWEVNNNKILHPFFDLAISNPISTKSSVISGLIIGLLSNYMKNDKLNNFVSFSYKLSNFFLQKIMMRLIPIYIYGIIVKVQHEVDIKTQLSNFGNMFLYIIYIQMIYIIFLLLIGENFSLNRIFNKIKHNIPALITCFSTMSRMVSLPIILKSAEKTSSNPSLPRLIMPLIINAHAIGESISLPIILLTIMQLNNIIMPDFSIYLNFAFIMSIAQFSAVSVPGGSLLILMPFLGSFFHFNDEMVALIYIFDIFFDSIGTMVNYLGDVAFIGITEKLWKRFKRKEIS